MPGTDDMNVNTFANECHG